jgi:hypothetical protein
MKVGFFDVFAWMAILVILTFFGRGLISLHADWRFAEQCRWHSGAAVRLEGEGVACMQRDVFMTWGTAP